MLLKKHKEDMANEVNEKNKKIKEEF